MSKKFFVIFMMSLFVSTGVISSHAYACGDSEDGSEHCDCAGKKNCKMHKKHKKGKENKEKKDSEAHEAQENP